MQQYKKAAKTRKNPYFYALFLGIFAPTGQLLNHLLNNFNRND